MSNEFLHTANRHSKLCMYSVPQKYMRSVSVWLVSGLDRVL